MKEIKRIDGKSVAKVQAVFMGVMATILAVFAGLGLIIAGDLVAGLVTLVVLPIAYIVMGYVFGFALAFVYNLVAKKVGGVKIEIRD